MSPILSTAMHIFELITVVAAAWLILQLFNLNTEQNLFVVSIVLAAFAKYERADQNSDIPDYVNGPQTPASK